MIRMKLNYSVAFKVIKIVKVIYTHENILNFTKHNLIGKDSDISMFHFDF